MTTETFTDAGGTTWKRGDGPGVWIDTAHVSPGFETWCTQAEIDAAKLLDAPIADLAGGNVGIVFGVTDDGQYLAALDDETGYCEGHESLAGALMGQSDYCDGTCNPARFRVTFEAPDDDGQREWVDVADRNDPAAFLAAGVAAAALPLQ